MTLTDPFVVEGLVDRPRPWRVIAGGERTGGQAMFGDARIPPNTPGPGRHVHTHEDEAIYVVSGTLTVEVGGERYEVGPESLVWMPREVPHAFANLSDVEVRTVGFTTPSGLEGLFAEQAEYFATLSGPPDSELLLRLSVKYGVRPVAGPALV